MIAFLEGVVAGKTAASVLLNVGGVGFEVGMPTSGLSRLPGVGEKALVHTYLQVRDDGMSLYGFSTLEEKALFERLIAINGVGPKMALAVLSLYEPSKLVDLISAQDVSAVQRVPGVGKKIASRIILELKGSFDDGLMNLFEEEKPAESQAMMGAREALLSMSFTSAEVDLALKGAPEDATENALLQYALKKLGS